MSNWLPIETAPKDGKVIACCEFKTCKRIAIAVRHDGGKWRLYGIGTYQRQPTHWQPLPEPPA